MKKSNNNLKHIFKLFISIITIILLLVLYNNSANAATTKVKKISLNKTSCTLNLKSQVTLKATITPNNATNKKIKWYTTNSSIATVDSKGKVTAKGVGETYITAVVSGTSIKSRCNIKVIRPVTALKISTKSVTLVEGKLYTIKTSITPSNATNKKLKMTSNNSKIVEVCKNGKLLAKSKGTAKITVCTTDGSNKKAYLTVNVKHKAKGITISKKESTIGIDETLKLSSKVSPSDAIGYSIEWISSNSDIATVNSKGEVTGKKVGSTCIYSNVKGTDISTYCYVTVVDTTEYMAINSVVSTENNPDFRYTIDEKNLIINIYGQQSSLTNITVKGKYFTSFSVDYKPVNVISKVTISAYSKVNKCSVKKEYQILYHQDISKFIPTKIVDGNITISDITYKNRQKSDKNSECSLTIKGNHEKLSDNFQLVFNKGYVISDFHSSGIDFYKFTITNNNNIAVDFYLKYIFDDSYYKIESINPVDNTIEYDESNIFVNGSILVHGMKQHLGEFNIKLYNSDSTYTIEQITDDYYKLYVTYGDEQVYYNLYYTQDSKYYLDVYNGIDTYRYYVTFQS